MKGWPPLAHINVRDVRFTLESNRMSALCQKRTFYRSYRPVPVPTKDCISSIVSRPSLF